MATVYSYIRFSTKKQAKGDSLKRQIEGEEWIERNGHNKASLTLHDLGVSAFRGKHRHTGALRTFLNAIESGQVEKGSILLVEHLDRLSREGIYDALPIWLQILNAGVMIAVLKPDEYVYSRPTDPNEAMISVMLPLVYFYIAHLESLRKSQTLTHAWQEKRRKAREDNTPFNRRCPSWISWDEEKKRFTLNDGAKAVRFIFEQTVEGLGQRYVVKALQKHFQPIGLSGKWNSSFVQKVLSDRAVLGEFQPFTVDEIGERVPEGSPIEGYYPAVIEEPLWLRAQAAKRTRFKARGKSGEFVNLFVGLIKNVNDGQKMHVQKTVQRRNGENEVIRRLVSYGHLRHIHGSDPVSIPYHQFEEAILWRLSELSLSDLQQRSTTDDGLDASQQELEALEQRYDELVELLSNPQSKQRPEWLHAAAEKVARQRDALREKVEKLKAVRHVGQPLDDVHSIFDVIADTPEEEMHDLRLRLRARIGEIVDDILVKPEKHFGRVWVLAQICFGEQYNCGFKSVIFGPSLLGEGFRKDYDLTDRRDCRKVIFAELATKKAQPEVVDFDGRIPQSIGKAAKVWLSISRSNMSKKSFRVVPSKIQRFVDFMGASTPVKEITADRWNEWTTLIKCEMKSGELEFSTARVIYSRVRELVRWLIEHGQVETIPALRISARLALQ